MNIDERKGLLVKEELLLDILKDYELSTMILYDEKGRISIDFEKYAKRGHYFPLNGCYSKGWEFMKALNECNYRTQDNLIHLIIVKEQENLVKKRYRIPLYDPILLAREGSAASSCPPDMVYEEIEVWEVDRENNNESRSENRG